MSKTTIFTFSVALLLLFGMPGVAAQPGLGHQFWGNVFVNGEASTENFLVEARINGDLVEAGAAIAGEYGMDSNKFVISDSSSGSSYEGELISFFVDGSAAAEFIFENAGTTELDLFITRSTPPPPPGGGGSGGGGGGGGGGGPPRRTVINETIENTGSEEFPGDTVEVCEEDWQCSDWLQCVNGQQTRVCVDKNDCGTEDNKPSEQQGCAVEVEESAATGGFFDGLSDFFNNLGFTGFATGGTPTLFGAAAGAIVILGILIYAVASRGPKKKNKNKK